jgi:AcrR family transcriptional regulator
VSTQRVRANTYDRAPLVNGRYPIVRSAEVVPGVDWGDVDGLEGRTRTRRPHEKLARLLAGGAEVFARDGYTRATVEEICRSAGVSVGSFYDHFENKADLILRIAEELTAPAVVLPSKDPRQLEGAVRELLTSGTARIVRAWLEAIVVEPELDAEQLRLRRANLARYSGWVREARARLGVSGALSDRAAARATLALLKEAITADWDPVAERAGELSLAVWVLLYGDPEARSPSIAERDLP